MSTAPALSRRQIDLDRLLAHVNAVKRLELHLANPDLDGEAWALICMDLIEARELLDQFGSARNGG